MKLHLIVSPRALKTEELARLKVGGNFTRYKSEKDRTTIALNGATTNAIEKVVDGIEGRDNRSQKLTMEENSEFKREDIQRTLHKNSSDGFQRKRTQI